MLGQAKNSEGANGGKLNILTFYVIK